MSASEHNEEQEAEIRFFKLNEVDPNYRINHNRIPDLSADIRIVFPTEEYIGKYLSHGKSKTVFIIRSSSCNMNRFDGNILKISRESDIEPMIAMTPNPHGFEITPKLYYDGIG